MGQIVMGKGLTGMAAALAGCLALAACGSPDKQPRLLYLERSQNGPDEFGILPTKPLETPPNYAELPVPTPGAGNRVDPTPDADVAVALGGSASATQLKGGIGAGDAALVAAASRFGRQEGIRQTVAAEDLRYRQQNHGKLLERLLRQNTYGDAYAPQSLDQYYELYRWRNAGTKTPAAPPEPDQ